MQADRTEPARGRRRVSFDGSFKPAHVGSGSSRSPISYRIRAGRSYREQPEVRLGRGSLRCLWLAGGLLVLAGASYPQSAPLQLFPAPPPGPPVPLPDAFLTKAYFGSVSTNGVGPTNWSFKGLPPGLTFTPGATFANIVGTPTALGTFVFAVQASDTQLGQVASQNYSITVIPRLTFTTPAILPSATV